MMEEEIAQVKFTGMGEVGIGKGSGEGSDNEEDECEATRAMVVSQNRKGKKSGGFQSMGFSYAVFKGVMKKGYRVPTPIQRKCIPLIMDGKDVVAMARTGSGKTAAFLLPMFERLKIHSTKIGARAVVLSPARELATQTFKFAKELGRFTSLQAVLVLGGDSMEDQFSAIHGNPDIIIATPGRFLHLLVEMDLTLSSVEYIVFDEADRLFEMGFAEQLQDIIRRLPESRQTLLFSATLPRMLVEFAKAGLKDPVLLRLDVDSKLSDQLRLYFLSVRKEDKASALLYLLQSVLPSTEQTAIFVPTKHHVEYLKELLQQVGVSCACIYSSLDQTARKINVAKFVNKKVMTILVTDVAARGIDIPALDNVINYNFPAKSKLFVHRVGRVARAGRSGSAYSLISSDEVAYLLDLHLFIGRPLLLEEQGSSGVYGSVPQSLLDQEDDHLKQLHSLCPDLVELKHISENAQKQYVRSRGQPAPESIRRAKHLPKCIPMHPMFTSLCSADAVAQCQLLDNLKLYKPSQTIFDIHRTKKSATIKKERKVLDTTKVKAEHYIEYTPRDVHSERGLSLATSFDRQANSAVLDLDGDEGGGSKRETRKTKHWDRKRKKFVGESEKDAPRKKRIKTESGQWIQASYKSNVYREWKEKHKIDGFNEEEAGTRTVAHRYRHNKKVAEHAKGQPVGDLKSKAAILRKRQRNGALEQRKKQKPERKGALEQRKKSKKQQKPRQQKPGGKKFQGR